MFAVNGGFGTNVEFSAEVPDFDKERIKADASIKNFLYRKDDVAVQLSLDAAIRGEKVKIDFESLKANAHSISSSGY